MYQQLETDWIKYLCIYLYKNNIYHISPLLFYECLSYKWKCCIMIFFTLSHVVNAVEILLPWIFEIQIWEAILTGIMTRWQTKFRWLERDWQGNFNNLNYEISDPEDQRILKDESVIKHQIKLFYRSRNAGKSLP